MNRPIFILGAHKSGTTLMRNLLDGHPDLFVAPFEMHIFKNLDKYASYPLRRHQPDGRDFKVSAKTFMEEVKNSRNEYSDLHYPAIRKINISRFNRVMDKNYRSDLPERDKCLLYIDALQAASGVSGKNLRFVEKSVENSEFTVDLNSMFPGAYFIHIIRNPYPHVVSIRNYQILKTGKYPDLEIVINTILENYQSNIKNTESLPRYATVMYEDLVRHPRSTMHKVAEYLDLSHDRVLLKPTSFGLPWLGNSTTKQKFAGIYSGNLDSWKEKITQTEINQINGRLEPYLEWFGYEKYENQPDGKKLTIESSAR